MKERQIKKRRRKEKRKELTLVSLKNVTNQTSSFMFINLFNITFYQLRIVSFECIFVNNLCVRKHSFMWRSKVGLQTQNLPGRTWENHENSNKTYASVKGGSFYFNTFSRVKWSSSDAPVRCRKS